MCARRIERWGERGEEKDQERGRRKEKEREKRGKREGEKSETDRKRWEELCHREPVLEAAPKAATFVCEEKKRGKRKL